MWHNLSDIDFHLLFQSFICSDWIESHIMEQYLTIILKMQFGEKKNLIVKN